MLKKTRGDRKEAVVERTQKHEIYQAIKEIKTEHPDYSIDELCSIGEISRAGYYKWLNRKDTKDDILNKKLVELIKQIHEKHPDMGYRRICDWLKHYYEIHVNEKRVLRICRILGIQSVIKNPHNCCTRPAKDPYYLAENKLNRNFTAQKPNEKWLTDVTEFKYYIGPEKKKCKIYLSAILDLYDRRIVSFEIGDSNNNALVFANFTDAVEKNPDVHPLLHSDRGFQYTNKTFHDMLEKAGLEQSMSRVGKCIDNGPMEGFWGILKREHYYGKTFTTREELVEMIKNYITYYNNERIQRNLGTITPIEKYNNYMMAA